MAFSTAIRQSLNAALSPLNLRIDTLTADKTEAARLEALSLAGHFNVACYPLSPGMETYDPAFLAAAYGDYADQIRRLKSPGANDVGYVYAGNTFFASPDMEVLYCLVRKLAPKRIVEVGCGSSTRISRQAILDGGLNTQIIAIDPLPRDDIAALVDRLIQTPLEDVDQTVFEELEAGDVLFIDSSHEVRVGNDCARLYCGVLPALKPGVVVHVHDVFLPFDYPRDMLHIVATLPRWGEQYLLHAMLQGGRREIIWPGHYVQRLRPDVSKVLPFLGAGRAQSFWFRTS